MFNNTDDDDKENLYDEFEEEEVTPQPKEPAYPTDDPRYWDKEEGEWEHLRPSTPARRWMLLGGGLFVLILLFTALGIWIFAPYVSDAVQYGYVEHIEKRGDMFKTWEGTLIPFKSIHDTTRVYEGDFVFSTDDKIGPALREFQNSGRPLRVEYRTYRFALPWRGDSKTVIVRVDTVARDSIMPYRR